MRWPSSTGSSGPGIQTARVFSFIIRIGALICLPACGSTEYRPLCRHDLMRMLAGHVGLCVTTVASSVDSLSGCQHDI